MPDEKNPDLSTTPRIKIKIESLSDLVFGLALSIGSLELLARTPIDASELAVNLGLFAFSFFVIISIWLGYARIVAITPEETGRALGLNLFLLFLVVLEPYLFFVLQSRPDTVFVSWASLAYAIDVGSMFLILAGMIRIALQENKAKEDKLHPILFRRLRLATKFYSAIGGLYVISALPFFWVDSPIGPVRFVFWYSAFGFVLFGIINRRREKASKPIS